jgi:PilZ domain
VSESCTVVIAAANVLPTLKERSAAVNGEVLAFSDAEAVRALEVIIKRRPRLVTIERMFATTPRGVALINRIKADPGLADLEIQVVAHDADDARVVRKGAASEATPAAPSGQAASSATSKAAKAPATPPAPQKPIAIAPTREPAAATASSSSTGTRRASRTRMTPDLDITVDGTTATLIDLSGSGAQVVSPSGLKPNQRVRIVLADDQANVKVAGSVAWASFEITKNGPRYRAGIEFVKPDVAAIEAFGDRHRQ